MKRVDTKRRQIESELDRRRTKRQKDDDEFKVVEGVIDPPTLKALYKLLNRGTIHIMHGAINAGKEANVYRGEDQDGAPLAVKIYRVSTAETDFMLEYIIGDPRFRRIKKQSRMLVPQWALKEFKNLTRYHEAGVRVPRPFDIERNVLVMEFIGDKEDNHPAPLLKNVELADPLAVFNEIINMIETSYVQANLVHADLSEYNILWQDGPVFIDVSQAVMKVHPNAKKYLYRDIQNVTRYFHKLGIDSEEPSVITKYILESGEKTDAIS